MESQSFRNSRISDLHDFADSLERYDGDFLSTLKDQRTSKSLWADIYFYLIGDPMKTKDNKIRAYIKRELEENEARTTKQINKLRNVSFNVNQNIDNKHVKFNNSTDIPHKHTVKVSNKELRNNVNLSEDIFNITHQRINSRLHFS